MKTLLIICSIILISFQVDRLLVTELPDIFAGTGKKTPALNKAISIINADLLATIPSNNAESPALNNRPAVASKALKIEAVSNKKEKPTKINMSNSHFAKSNSKNVHLHQAMKQSGKYLELSTLQFEFNKHEILKNTAFNTILQIADKLIYDQSLKISIAGFTDNIGNTAYNKTLSLLRANNIRQYMIDLGVNENQIIVSANGISYPVTNNNTVEERATNRRVEMIIFQ